MKYTYAIIYIIILDWSKYVYAMSIVTWIVEYVSYEIYLYEVI